MTTHANLISVESVTKLTRRTIELGKLINRSADIIDSLFGTFAVGGIHQSVALLESPSILNYITVTSDMVHEYDAVTAFRPLLS